MKRVFAGFLENFSFMTCTKFALILIFTLGTAFAQIPTNGLKGQWKLDGNAIDASGNNNNGTLQGGAVYCEDRFGKANSAVKFGGFYNSSAIHIPNSPSLHLNSELTIACWVKIDDPSGMDDWGNYTSTEQARHTFFAKDGNRSGFSSGFTPSLFRFAFGIVNNTSCSHNASFALIDYNCIDLEWVHVAIVVDDVSIALYLNGIRKHRETYYSQITFPEANNNDLTFGRYGYNCGSGINFWYPLNGKMDDIFYYNRALSQEEIGQLYNYPAAYTHPPMITETISDDVCLGEKYEKNGFSLPEHQQTGLFTYSRNNGCDSAWVLNLNVINCNTDSLDFDTYAVIICNRVILLNLKKLADDGFDVTHCKWFKNGKEMPKTHTINAFSFSEGPDKELETAPNYYSFRLITKNFGELPSTEKIIIHPDKAPKCPEIESYNPLTVYPNPIIKGGLLTLEGLMPQKTVYVYNHIGETVLRFTATESSMKLTFDFPQGIYLVRTEERIVKVVVK